VLCGFGTGLPKTWLGSGTKLSSPPTCTASTVEGTGMLDGTAALHRWSMLVATEGASAARKGDRPRVVPRGRPRFLPRPLLTSKLLGKMVGAPCVGLRWPMTGGTLTGAGLGVLVPLARPPPRQLELAPMGTASVACCIASDKLPLSPSNVKMKTLHERSQPTRLGLS
jgi:hypothetical protein